MTFRGVKELAAGMLRKRGVTLMTRDNLPGDGFVKAFLKEFSSRFEKTDGNKVTRTKGHRLASDNSLTRKGHTDLINQIMMENPIVMDVNIDESSVGSNNLKEHMTSRKLRFRFTKQGLNASLPCATMSVHTTFLAGMALYVDDLLTGGELRVPDEGVPPLYVCASASSVNIPDNPSLCIKGARFAVQPSGSVTLPIFVQYIDEVMIPYLQRAVPGGLQKGEREVLLTFDLPKVHLLPAWLCQKLADLGIHAYCFPHNSTHWSQMMDHRHAFGTFKPSYYDGECDLDLACTHTQRPGYLTLIDIACTHTHTPGYLTLLSSFARSLVVL